jgi:hypothetical protein
MTKETAISPQLDGTLLAPGGLSAAEFEVLTQESATKAKNLTNVISNNKGRYIVEINPDAPAFLKYEAWATIAAGYNMAASIESEPELLYDHDGTSVIGAKAYAVVRNIVTGTRTGGAPAYCMFSERNWGNRTLNQVVSMAGTRAASKALRLMFSWVVVLAGYEPTPFEELDDTIIQEMRDRGPAARREAPANRTETPIKGVVEAVPVSASDELEYCPLHTDQQWYTNSKEGRSWRSHRFTNDFGDAEWCNENNVKKQHPELYAVQAPPKPTEPEPQPDGPPVPDTEEEGTDEIVADTLRLIEEAKNNA